MEILVKSDNLRQETTAKGNVIRKQQAALDQGRDFPLVFELSLPPGQAPYPPGRYRLAPDSFRTNPWGGIELDPYGIRLAPAK